MLRFAPIAVLAVALAGPAQAREYYIGGPVKQADMEIVANYLKGIQMAPMPGVMTDMAESGDAIHLEADIHATADNPYGYPDGAWVPYLRVDYDLKKAGDSFHAMGKLYPMTATDGPHYAANVAMGGPGQYTLTYVIDPPDPAIFGRHIDKATGVPDWWKPITVTFTFKYPQS
jgi:uncharacterized protein involved in high-affinity Fe2+ transport